MAKKFLEIVFTPKVLAAQQAYYSHSQAPPPVAQEDALGPYEQAFIESRDSFYLSSVSETGWPYLQHRGGPPGFCRVSAPNRIAFADFSGNRQLISTGNVLTNDRVCLFMMDYPQRTRLKILGHAEVLAAREHPELVRQIAPPGMERTTERIFQIRVVSFDWNCPKYITPRFTEAEVREIVAPLKARIAELESRLNQSSE